MNKKDPVFRSLAMIEERIHEKLTVEMLAQDIHFSKYHYQRIFRKAVGDTVMGYVTKRKLSLASGELAGTMDSVLAIALKYGYDSHEGFTRSFKAYLGVTPTEYRKYHSTISFPVKKEECVMIDSKNTEKIIRELNSLIVQTKKTAAGAEKYEGTDVKAAAVYAQVWKFASERTEKLADRLKEVSERVIAVTQHPDEISVYSLIMKAVGSAAFEASVTAFQVGLMIARAMPEHCATFCPLCDQYDNLAQNAWEASGKMANFCHELLEEVFQNMRKDAVQRIQNTVDTGRKAAGKLADPALPYGYIADAILVLTEELSALPLEEITVSFLEDSLFRLETILFAADMDMLRAPQHRPLFDDILELKEKLGNTAEFFQSLSQDTARVLATLETYSEINRAAERRYREFAAQEGVLLFYLKGEIQKLGDTHLDENQKKAMDAIYSTMANAVNMARCATDRKKENEIVNLLRKVYDDLMTQAKQLGMYGGALEYLAEKTRKPLIDFIRSK